MRSCLAPGYHDQTLLLAFWPHSGARYLAPPCLGPASPLTPVLKFGCGHLVPGSYASLAPHTPFSSVDPVVAVRSLGQARIADERDPPPVRRPRRNVDRSLSPV